MDLSKKGTTLKSIFIQYLAVVMVTLLIITVVFLALLFLGYKSGLMVPANAVELALKASKDEIASSDPFDEKLIPTGATYILLSEDGSYRQGNMDEETKAIAEDFLKDRQSIPYGEGFFVAIPRADGVCVVQYQIRASFSVDWMNRYFPSVEATLLIFYGLMALSGCLGVSYYFARRLRRQLQPIMLATEKIREQDLNFSIEGTKVREFNHVLQAVSDMKEALQEALTTQWKQEQAKREQVSALAHDIKTPLTIIKGNLELLKELDLPEKEKLYLAYATKNTERIEHYIHMLIELTHMSGAHGADMKAISTADLIGEWEMAAQSLAVTTGHGIEFCHEHLPTTIMADRELLLRALTNVLVNAMEYSPQGETVEIEITSDGVELQFTVKDRGQGFSTEELKHGTEEFYRGDSSRSGSGHYGIGLYMAQQVAELHGGHLKLANRSEGSGGLVTLVMALTPRE